MTDGVRNPLFGPSSLFLYRNSYMHTELRAAYNKDKSNEPIHRVLDKMESRYYYILLLYLMLEIIHIFLIQGMDHSCHSDEERLWDLQMKYVNGMEDTEHETNGTNNRLKVLFISKFNIKMYSQSYLIILSKFIFIYVVI